MRRTRICEAEDAVPGSQDSITRGVRNLKLTDFAAAKPARTHRAPPPMPNSRRPTQQRSRHQRAYLRCTQCGAESGKPGAYAGNTDTGLMGHMGQKHGSHPSKQESVSQLRQVVRAACVTCGTFRSRRRNRCNHCRADAATREK